jgi:hypothetical protein
MFNVTQHIFFGELFRPLHCVASKRHRSIWFGKLFRMAKVVFAMLRRNLNGAISFDCDSTRPIEIRVLVEKGLM